MRRRDAMIARRGMRRRDETGRQSGGETSGGRWRSWMRRGKKRQGERRGRRRRDAERREQSGIWGYGARGDSGGDHRRGEAAGLTVRDFTVLLLIFVLVSSVCWEVRGQTSVCRCSRRRYVTIVVLIAVVVVVAVSSAFVIPFVVSDASSSRLLSGCLVAAFSQRLGELSKKLQKAALATVENEQKKGK